MTYRIRITKPQSPIEGWNGKISFDQGTTWHRVTKYVGGGLVAFDSKEQLLKAADRLARRIRP